MIILKICIYIQKSLQLQIATTIITLLETTAVAAVVVVA
jgi:hypothetical protein